MTINYEKAYKEALKRAKTIHNEHRAQYADVMVKVFPELRESEDELMRKEAIAIIKQYNIICEREGDKCYTTDRVISWLEKQGEQNPSWRPSEEQMEALNWIAYNYALMDKGTEEKLQSLYNDLKKL